MLNGKLYFCCCDDSGGWLFARFFLLKTGRMARQSICTTITSARRYRKMRGAETGAVGLGRRGGESVSTEVMVMVGIYWMMVAMLVWRARFVSSSWIFCSIIRCAIVMACDWPVMVTMRFRVPGENSPFLEMLMLAPERCWMSTRLRPLGPVLNK